METTNSDIIQTTKPNPSSFFSEDSNSNELNNDEDRNSSSNNNSPPIISFGLISDIQYADADDAYNYAGDKMRFYRQARILTHEACKYWSALPDDINFKFILQLGDLIDGKCKKSNKVDECLNDILSEFKNFKLYHVWGNHEFYNFQRADLATNLLNTSKMLLNDSSSTTNENANYYSFDLTNRLRLICVDSYDFSMLGLEETDDVYIKAQALLMQHNKNSDLNSAAGLRGHAKRFTKFNGSISTKQLSWLGEQLKQCKDSSMKAIVCGHVPVHPQAVSSTMCLAWNYREILDTLWSYGNTVVGYFCGHDHDGGYFRDKLNIHHLTFKAVVETPANTNSFATVKVCKDRILVEGVGMMEYYEIYF